jgi:hypothetical protein
MEGQCQFRFGLGDMPALVSMLVGGIPMPGAAVSEPEDPTQSSNVTFRTPTGDRVTEGSIATISVELAATRPEPFAYRILGGLMKVF